MSSRKRKFQPNPTHEIYEDEERGTDAQREPRTHSEAAVLENSRRKRRHVLFPDLNANENGDQDAEEDEESNDATVTPGVLGSSPL